jgi:hypothetical protein
VRHLEAGEIASRLGDQDLIGRRKAAGGAGGGAVEQELGVCEFLRHVGTFPSQRLELAQWPAELHPVVATWSCAVLKV